jgi:hypothetical protein
MKDFNLYEDWAEYIGIILAFVGFFIAIFMSEPLFSYVSVGVLGFLLGRIFYVKHFSEPIFPFVIMILAFFIGYFAGSFFISRLIVFIIFVSTFVISYYLHKEKIIKIFKSRSFLK